ncbi:MAG TPA: 3-deoxy-7-phosphoheptulonate synthase class II [Phycisphaerales bacterium]|nr:3-deoxy-7-phosphoheptulonate synthase class II [Phycisphaerales bacterium]
MNENAAHNPATRPPEPGAWSPQSWRARLAAQQARYDDPGAVARAVAKLSALPPLVTSWEIERLRALISDAQEGRRFLLQGGDCAETLDDCRPETIANKLKILLQMSLVLVQGLRKPVIRVGRFAGQYAKPRSSPTETQRIDGRDVTLPSYFGDLVNLAPFDEASRKPDPHLMVRGYQHAAMTLNFIRSLIDGGFADVHHPEYWDLSFFHHASLPPERREAYERVSRTLAEALEFMEALGEAKVHELTRVEFFTSHEGLNLLYESAQTRQVPRRSGWYDLTTHLPWIGERTRDPGGAHVEFFRGIANPVGVKLGPKTDPAEAAELARVLNPENLPGKLVLITRMGAPNVERALPGLIDAIARAGRRVLWVSDPMHGNGMVTAGGVKTRSFDAIAEELRRTCAVHRAAGSQLGGVHFELTGEDVTECLGGASGVTEDCLTRNYASPCDPRLNYQQSLELAFILSEILRNGRP